METLAVNGALLIHKPGGVSSFGVIDALQKATGKRRRDLPKMGHGGTLDPFATGLLIVCVGSGVKLARYFLGSEKEYTGVIRFGQTTISGDLTDPVTQTHPHLPTSIDELRQMAKQISAQPYLQTPPMHSAKKKDGKPLYELARQGIEVEREPKLCHLSGFEILDYEPPLARFKLRCSSGTYVRTLAQDFARLLGTMGMLDSLERTASGAYRLERAMSLDSILAATQSGQPWDELDAWIPFDLLLSHYPRSEATIDEAEALTQGRQNVLFNLVKRAESAATTEDPHLAIYCRSKLIAIAKQEQGVWGLERVFTPPSQ